MKVKIFYFSGTGNTKLIGEEFRKMFIQYKYTSVDLITIEEVLKKTKAIGDLENETLLVIGFPVYDLHHPEIISKFIGILPQIKKPIPVFLFCTMAFIKGDCLDITSKALKQKGYYVINKAGFQCPSNGVAIYEKPKHKRYKNVRFEKNIQLKINIMTMETGKLHLSFIKKVFHNGGIINPFFNIIRMISEKTYGDKYYRNLLINDNCSVCRACEKLCPDNNLILKDNKIFIKKNNGCLRCLRCISICPQQAIAFTSSPKIANYNRITIMKLYEKANNI